jgi:Protein of unknown function (DUF3108)
MRARSIALPSWSPGLGVRRRRGLALVLRGALALTVGAHAACGGTAEAFTPPPAAAPATRGDVGLFPGESMSFEVRLGGVAVGEAALAVGERGQFNGRPAITVRSKISTTGAVRLVRPVDDEATTLIDTESGAPLQLDTHVLLGGQETFTKATFAAGRAVVEVKKAIDGQAVPYTFVFGDLPTLDAHSAMADLRGWRPAAGATRTVWLVGGRRLWRVDLTYVGKDSVGTAEGNREASRLDGIAYRVAPDRSVDTSRPPRRFSVWMSTDADRVPLRVNATTEFGDIEITLAEYQRP